jgi:hypothetical protein
MYSVKKVVPDTAYQMVATWRPNCLRQVVLIPVAANTPIVNKHYKH